MAQTAEIKVLISSDSTELQKTNDELEATGAIAGDVNKKFKDLENSNKQVEKGFVSLKTRVREAKEALQQAEDRFGPFSKEANIARQRAGELADQMADLNRQVGLLNPEDKIKAFTNLGQGVVGAFSIATGAVQAFGGESEEVQRIAQKLQGALNLVQGVQSIIGLKEAYEDIKVVLGLTTTAQAALTTTTVAGTAATEGATLATRAFSVALTATGIGAIVVALGALVGAWIAVEQSIIDAEEATKRYARAEKDREAAQTLFYETFDKALQKQITKLQFTIDLRKAEGATAKELLQLEIEKEKAINRALDAAIRTAKTRTQDEDKLIEEQEASTRRRQVLEAQLTKTILDEKKKRLQAGIEEMKSLGLESAKANELVLQLSDEGFARLQDVFRIVEADAFNVKEAILKINNELANTAPVGRTIAKTSAELNKELFARVEAQAEKSRDISFGLAQESFDFITQLSQNATQKQIEDLDKQKEQGIISEEKYQEKLKQIQIAAAKREKELAIFAASVAFAEALVKALTTKNPPAALVLAAAVGGLNLAKIIATPLPKFKEGSLNIGGGNLDADGGMHAIVHRGEAIIPADRNKSYHPTLEAIYNKQISPAEINSYVLNRLAGKSGIGRDTVVASVDTYGLSRALSKNKSVQIENAQTVGKAIASELARGYNRRQVV
jgi:predicted  nucleic acid-binding Zn-ribbon protein